MDAGAPIGYSLSGVVLAVGSDVADFHPGDHVAAAGAGLANHAEYVEVPRNLVVSMPRDLDFDSASTVALGAIAMQGVRRAEVRIGEIVVVVGVGMIGQLAVQLLHTAGVRVVAVDLDDHRLELAKQTGCELTVNPTHEDAVKAVCHFSGGYGADTVLFCAATSSSETLRDAFAMTRRKGKVVMVGVWGTELKREDIYAKEIDFLISTSYGPGRYDASFEQKGLDYPYAYVRWTETRNMAEYLRLLATHRIDIAGLIDNIFSIQEVEQAFQDLQAPRRPLIVLLDYGDVLPHAFDSLSRDQSRVRIVSQPARVKGDRIRVAIVGAGSFATGTHLPNLKAIPSFDIHAICSRSGAKAKMIAEQFGAEYATTDYQQILDDEDTDLVMICTRHNLHASMVLDSIHAGKHTFVEKPLCLYPAELEAIESFYREVQGRPDELKPVPLLTVGFNRRFAPSIKKIKKQIADRVNPMILTYRMNAGYVPPDHWIHDPQEGGGRIVGEACHILDLFSYLVDAPVRAYSTSSLRPSTDSISSSDNKLITLEYEDGSLGTIMYFSVGPKTLPKERFEVYWDGKSIHLEDYASVSCWGMTANELRTQKTDKGHISELKKLVDALRGDSINGWPIELSSLIETSRIAMMLQE